MPRTHPNDLLPGEVVDSQRYLSGQNSRAMANQARQTSALQAGDGLALGSGGETVGYSKERMVIGPANVNTSAAANFAVATSDLFLKKDKKGRTVNMDDPMKGGDRGMLTRTVATYETDKFLGLNSVAEEKFGLDANKKVIGISIQADGEGITSKKGLLDVDYADPTIQRGLSDLEVSDYITGQIDRHAGNIFIDPATGKVTGIDNDMGFPEVGRETITHPEITSKMVDGLPRRMHEDTAASILKKDPEALRAILSKPPPGKKEAPQPLSKEAIDGAVNRLLAMQAELKKKPSSIKLVKAFDPSTYADAITEQKTKFQQQTGVALDNLDPADTNVGLRNVQLVTKTSYSVTAYMTNYINDRQPDPADKMLKHRDAPAATRVPDAKLKERQAYQNLNKQQRKAFDETFEKFAAAEETLAKKGHELSQCEDPAKMGQLRDEVQAAKMKMVTLDADLDHQLKAGLQPVQSVRSNLAGQTPVRPTTTPWTKTTISPNATGMPGVNVPLPQRPTTALPLQAPQLPVTAVLPQRPTTTTPIPPPRIGKVLTRKPSVSDVTGLHSHDSSTSLGVDNSKKVDQKPAHKIIS